MRTLKILLLCVVALMATACGNNHYDPPIVYKNGNSYFVNYRGVVMLPSEGGATTIDLLAPEEESVIPIDLLATSAAIPLLPKETWPEYEETEMALLTERIYQEAGYIRYPNSLDFGYTFHWATFSTYKIPGSDRGILHVVFDENTEETPRKLYLHFNGLYNETVEVRQDGKSPV